MTSLRERTPWLWLLSLSVGLVGGGIAVIGVELLGYAMVGLGLALPIWKWWPQISEPFVPSSLPAPSHKATPEKPERLWVRCS